ncbi:DUF2076 domain-containing protein [Aeromonas aquatilis]
MQQQEQGLIDGLFDRLKQAQARDSKRDPQADQLIRQHLAELPDAPYYMTQALLIQQAALTHGSRSWKPARAPQVVAVFSPACLVAKAARPRVLRRHRQLLLPSQHPVPTPF